jgi:hypothetical protein
MFVLVFQSRVLADVRIVFSDIALGGVIGQGGFGRVYRGTWRVRGGISVLLVWLDDVRDVCKRRSSVMEIIAMHSQVCVHIRAWASHLQPSA